MCVTLLEENFIVKTSNFWDLGFGRRQILRFVGKKGLQMGNGHPHLWKEASNGPGDDIVSAINDRQEKKQNGEE